MTRFFKTRTLAAPLRMLSMTTSLGVLTSLMTGLSVPAQAQEPQTQLVITKVEANYVASQLVIHGQNLATASGVPPIVQFMGKGVGVVAYDAADVTISVPLAFLGAGSYLLTMSTGPNVEQNDSFEVTLGTQGPKGDPGPQGLTGPQGSSGLKGDKGDTGDTGPQGLKGDKGDTGPQGNAGPRGDTGPQGPSGPGALIITKDISVLTAIKSGCTLSTLASVECNLAINHYCADSNYLTGFGPISYNPTTRDVALVCLRK